jgi:PAS domain S-box-containing protein
MDILIIEDNDGLAELISEIAEKCGYTPKCVFCGSEALDFLSCGGKPDLILLDYSLPDMKGSDFINTLYENGMQVPPFVVTTGHGDEVVAVNMMKLGAKDYIVKNNLFLDRLPAVIKRVIREIENENHRKNAENQLLESKKLLNETQKLAKIGGWEWDISKQFMAWTEETYRIYGMNPEPGAHLGPDAVDISLSCYPQGARQALEIAFEQCAAEGKPYDMELPFITKKGKNIWVRTAAQAIVKDSKIVKIVGHIMDITLRKHAELQLIEAKEKAEESDRLKTAFLANMSHEIRTPMNAILGFADLLKNPGLDNENRNDYINIIQQSGVRMLNIINEIIDISKIEAGLMEIRPTGIRLNETLSSVLDLFKAEAKSKQLSLHLQLGLPDENFTIEADQEKLAAVIINLVKNAIKYTDKGRIEFGYSIEDNQTAEPMLVFYVNDTGIGIPAERRDAVFCRFVQADIEDRQARQGAGLGLSIAKAYVEMMGGQIWLESEEGIGSCFLFSLPLKKITEPNKVEALPVALKVSITRKLKCILAEDDQFSEMLVSAVLGQNGIEVIHARNGKEAVEAARLNPDAHFILMDIQMPLLNGYEATRQIRKFNQTVPIIAQTAYALTGDMEKALEAGCTDYLPKPLTRAGLIEMIDKHTN